MVSILRTTLWYVLTLYAALILAIALNLINQFSLHMHIFAWALGIAAACILHPEEEQSSEKKLTRIQIIAIVLLILVIIVVRCIPYLFTTVPLGYDAGIYRYAILHANTPESWMYTSFEPTFLPLMAALLPFISVDSLLTLGYILTAALLGITIFLYLRTKFTTFTAFSGLICYALSLVQLKVFTYLYYKNVLALALLCCAFYALTLYEKQQKKSHIVLFIFFGSSIAWIHRPTFLLFGLAYFMYTFLAPLSQKSWYTKKLSFNIFIGFCILFFALIPYLGAHHEAITSLLSPVAHSLAAPGESPGTFITFFVYQFSALIYLPFALVGLFVLTRSRPFDILTIFTYITLIIVYTQLFFFQRFIIHLDIALILCAAIGFTHIRKSLPKIIPILLICAAIALITTTILSVHPLITEEEKLTIESISQSIEPNASLLVLNAHDAPWVLGYSNHTHIIAPGLFDENQWDLAHWQEFWNTTDSSTVEKLMAFYPKPAYIYSGTESFNKTCFSPLEGKKYLAKYICH